MFCSKCGNPLPDNAKFCGACGAPVKISQEASPVPQQPASVSDEVGGIQMPKPVNVPKPEQMCIRDSIYVEHLEPFYPLIALFIFHLQNKCIYRRLLQLLFHILKIQLLQTFLSGLFIHVLKGHPPQFCLEIPRRGRYRPLTVPPDIHLREQIKICLLYTSRCV